VEVGMTLPALHTFFCDATEFGRVPSVVQEAEIKHGPVGVLINNAEYGHNSVL
jgi:short-subunit dehydrogenase